MCFFYCHVILLKFDLLTGTCFIIIASTERPLLTLETIILNAPINSRLNVVVRSPTPFGLGQNGCWTSRGSQLPRALLFIFSLCCSLNDCRRAAHSFLKIGRLFSLSLFSCPSSCPHSSSLDERQRSSQPWPHLPLLCVRWKCDLAGQVSAMLHLLPHGSIQGVHNFSSKFRTLDSSHSWSWPHS